MPPLAPIVAVLCVLRGALAVPAVGAQRPNVAVVDSWDRTDELGHFDGLPMLILYEDKGSGASNADFKKELAKVASDGRYKGLVNFLPVADVSSYDYWPVRGFAKRAVQKQSVATHTNILCDWSGALRDALGLTKKSSNVVLYDGDGRVIFAFAGALSVEQRTFLFGLLKEQVELAVKGAAK